MTGVGQPWLMGAGGKEIRDTKKRYTKHSFNNTSNVRGMLKCSHKCQNYNRQQSSQ